MDILKSTLSISRYWFLNPQSINALRMSCTPLNAGQAWSPIDDLPFTKSIGLVDVKNYEKPADAVEILGEFLFFRIRLDVKKVPAAVLNRRVEQALAQERVETGGGVSRARTKEIKESVRSRMEQAAEPVPHTVMVATDGREILVTTTTSWILEEVEVTLWSLFQDRPFVPANLFTLERWNDRERIHEWPHHAQRMGSEFLTSLYRNEGAGGLDTGQLEVHSAVQVDAPMGAERIQVAADGRSEWPEVSLALSDGQKMISKAGLLYSHEEKDFELKLNSDWSVQSLRMPIQDALSSARSGEVGSGILIAISLVQEVLHAIDQYALQAVENREVLAPLESAA